MLWGLDEYPETEMLSSWRELATDITLAPIDSGHFATEEVPQETAAALINFFSGQQTR